MLPTHIREEGWRGVIKAASERGVIHGERAAIEENGGSFVEKLVNELLHAKKSRLATLEVRVWKAVGTTPCCGKCLSMGEGCLVGW